MRGGSDIISGIQHLKKAVLHFESFCLEHPASKGCQLFKRYIKHISFVYFDLRTNPLLTEPVRNGIKAEWDSDVFAVDAISEKVALLNPEQRDAIEKVLDLVLAGHSINVEQQI